MITEIAVQELNTEQFIHEKVGEIKAAVGEGMAINALSGGVDSSTVTMLGHRALGNQLKTVFIENGLMREGEPEQVVGFFRDLGITVEVVDARQEFFSGDHNPTSHIFDNYQPSFSFKLWSKASSVHPVERDYPSYIRFNNPPAAAAC